MSKRMKILHGLIILVILLGAFYWFGLRPSQIRKECYDYANKNTRFNFYDSESEYRTDLNFIYGNCLKIHGLEK